MSTLNMAKNSKKINKRKRKQKLKNKNKNKKSVGGGGGILPIFSV